MGGTHISIWPGCMRCGPGVQGCFRCKGSPDVQGQGLSVGALMCGDGTLVQGETHFLPWLVQVLLQRVVCDNILRVTDALPPLLQGLHVQAHSTDVLPPVIRVSCEHFSCCPRQLSLVTLTTPGLGFLTSQCCPSDPSSRAQL